MVQCLELKSTSGFNVVYIQFRREIERFQAAHFIVCITCVYVAMHWQNMMLEFLDQIWNKSVWYNRSILWGVLTYHVKLLSGWAPKGGGGGIPCEILPGVLVSVSVWPARGSDVADGRPLLHGDLSAAGQVLGPAMVGRSGQRVSAAHANGNGHWPGGWLAVCVWGGLLRWCWSGCLGCAAVAGHTCVNDGGDGSAVSLGWVRLLSARHVGVHEVPPLQTLP